MRNTYWNEGGELQEEYKALYEAHVPSMGECATLAGEVLRASSRIYHDAYNNGFCNNTTGAWNFLNQYVPSKAMHTALNEIEGLVNCSCADYWMSGRDMPLSRIEEALEVIATEATRFAQSDFAQKEENPCDLFDLQDPDEYHEDEDEDEDCYY